MNKHHLAEGSFVMSLGPSFPSTDERHSDRVIWNFSPAALPCVSHIRGHCDNPSLALVYTQLLFCIGLMLVGSTSSVAWLMGWEFWLNTVPLHSVWVTLAWSLILIGYGFREVRVMEADPSDRDFVLIVKSHLETEVRTRLKRMMLGVRMEIARIVKIYDGEVNCKKY